MIATYWETLVAATYSGPDAAQLDTDPARQHAPTDRAGLRRAALELRRQGLLPRDIAAALRFSEVAIRELLAETKNSRTTPEIR